MLSRRKFVAFATLAFALSMSAALGTLLVADFYVHRKFEKAAGLNIWGYRGPTLGRKGPHEIRVAVLGGSTALGYGLPWTDAFPHQLEVALNATPATDRPRFVVVNLGMNSNGAYSFRSTLADYKYLSYDIVCLYEGYNDLGTNLRVSRRDSAIFRLTGYYPLLPVVMSEKAMALRHGGDIAAGYRNEKAVFRPSFGDRTKASALEAAGKIVTALDGVKSSTLGQTDFPEALSEGCGPIWGFYCHSVALAVADARAMRKPVLVVTQPYRNDAHRDQQGRMRAMLSARWGNDPAVRYVDLGAAIDLADHTLCWDGLHLTPVGNQKIAEHLVQPVQNAAPFVGR